MTDGLLGVLFGFAYRTLAVKAGKILRVRRELFLRGRSKALLTRLISDIRDELEDVICGEFMLLELWLKKDSNKFEPTGI